jgi:hypothetical protein
MVVDYLENPRRAPRARLRCEVSVMEDGGPPLQAFTEDVGPHGCQLVAPRSYAPGTELRLELRAQDVSVPLHATARVAWSSPVEPWRAGLAFGESSRPTASRFFEGLIASRPGLDAWRRVPGKISLDAFVWLAPPPRLVVDFTADEVGTLRAVGSGATIHEVRTRLRVDWTTAQRALFSLLAAGYVTLEKARAARYADWADLLQKLESELASAPTRPSGPRYRGDC